MLVRHRICDPGWMKISFFPGERVIVRKLRDGDNEFIRDRETLVNVEFHRRSQRTIEIVEMNVLLRSVAVPAGATEASTVENSGVYA